METFFNADDFEREGFVIIDHFLTNDILEALRLELQRRKHEGRMSEAHVGRGAEKVRDPLTRGDFISWIDPARDVEVVKWYVGKVNDVMSQLNRMFYLGLRDFEAHLTEYPEGSFYKRHTDRHRSGSSRRVSFLLYLNDHWKEGDGGELRIYRTDESYFDIAPVNGRFALFLSEMEHEVLPTNVVRRSVTGWMLNEPLMGG